MQLGGTHPGPPHSPWNLGGTLVEPYFRTAPTVGGTLVEPAPVAEPRGSLVEPWSTANLVEPAPDHPTALAELRGTLVEPWWNPGGTLVEPWWNPGGTRPGPPRSLSGPLAFSCWGKERRALMAVARCTDRSGSQLPSCEATSILQRPGRGSEAQEKKSWRRAGEEQKERKEKGQITEFAAEAPAELRRGYWSDLEGRTYIRVLLPQPNAQWLRMRIAPTACRSPIQPQPRAASQTPRHSAGSPGRGCARQTTPRHGSKAATGIRAQVAHRRQPTAPPPPAARRPPAPNDVFRLLVSPVQKIG